MSIPANPGRQQIALDLYLAFPSADELGGRMGRIDMDIDSPEIDLMLSKIHVWPLDLGVCRMIAKLDFRGDPADEFIAATSLVHNVPLLTRDRVILHSKMVPLA